ncbi:MAG: hypothetical protein GC147_03140 [Porphyrobacter sp.]|nr:hypothetical protein [Porphyrobacter sp.]
MPRPEREIHVADTDAKAGSNEGVVRWVLLISTGLAIVVLTIIWVTGALTEGPVESERTASGRLEAEAEQQPPVRSDTDGIDLEDGSSLSEQGPAQP